MTTKYQERRAKELAKRQWEMEAIERTKKISLDGRCEIVREVLALMGLTAKGLVTAEAKVQKDFQENLLDVGVLPMMMQHAWRIVLSEERGGAG